MAKKKEVNLTDYRVSITTSDFVFLENVTAKNEVEARKLGRAKAVAKWEENYGEYDTLRLGEQVYDVQSILDQLKKTKQIKAVEFNPDNPFKPSLKLKINGEDAKITDEKFIGENLK